MVHQYSEVYTMAYSRWKVVQFLCFLAMFSDRLELGESFNVSRGIADSFANPDCDALVCPRNCVRYDAGCASGQNECVRCSCNEQYSHNYLGDGKGQGECLTDGEIVKPSVADDSLMIAATSRRNSLTTLCVKADPVIVVDDSCRLDVSNWWLYTDTKHLMNLKRLECLDGENPSKVMVVPCSLASKYQKWECNKSRSGVYERQEYVHQLNGGKTSYLQFNENDKTLYLDDSSGDEFYRRYSKTVSNHRSLCGTPVEYQGCYRFNVGTEMRDLYYSKFGIGGDCQSDCFTTMKVLAPIFTENKECKLVWQDSSFLRNDQPWKLVTGNSSGFSVSGPEKDYRGIVLKVTYDAYWRWSNTILKLQVQCSSKTSSEQQCILLKMYDLTAYERNLRKPTGPSSHSESNAYKVSIIAMSVIVAILF